MGNGYTIGRVAQDVGCRVQTIRYYEQIGLMPPAERSAGNQRLYAGQDVERLIFIRHARELGFSIEQIRDLLRLASLPDTSCEAADGIARHHLDEVRRRLSRLRALESELERMVESCAGGRVAQCRVIEALSDHGQCLHERHDEV